MVEQSGLVGAELAAGSLLLASPELEDINFSKSVVLLLDVNADGALGVVVNRPSPVLVADVLEGWAPFCTQPDVLFRGGPVSTGGAIAVVRSRFVQPPPGWRPVRDDIGMIDLDTPRELLGDSLAGMRVYAGYAGWGAGQLEGEIARGDWYVLPGQPEDLFLPDTSSLRIDILRRQPGDLALHATRPYDPDHN